MSTKNFVLVFFYFCFLRRIGWEFFSILVVLFGSSHLKTWYFRKFLSPIWSLLSVDLANDNFVKEKGLKQAKSVFVNRSNRSTYGKKMSKICDSTQKSLASSYMYRLLISNLFLTHECESNERVIAVGGNFTRSMDCCMPADQCIRLAQAFNLTTW